MYTIHQGRKATTTAGTAVPLVATSKEVAGVVIVAETDNTDYIAVGDSAVVEADATRTGAPLGAGDSIPLGNVDLKDIYIDSAIDGEGVTYLYWG